MANKGNRGAARRSARLDVVQAKQGLASAVSSLVRRYEIDGLIDRRTQEFAFEYKQAVLDVVQPYYGARDADALAELSVARLEQLLRINIDDGFAFFGRELHEITVQLENAFDLCDYGQRSQMLELLVNFLINTLGGRHGWLCDSERNLVEDFIGDVYAWDPRFAPDVIQLADMRLEELSAAALALADNAPAKDPDGGYEWNGVADAIERTQMHWSMTRLTAMATCKESAVALYAYAEKSNLLGYTEALFLISNAYETAGDPRKGIAILREHMDAIDMFYAHDLDFEPPQLTDNLLSMAWKYYSKVELVDLYCELLLNDKNTATFAWYQRDDRVDIVHWYDELRGMVRTPDWDMLRASLLSLVSDKRREVLLNHERNVRAFHRQMIQVLNDGFSVADQYEEDSSGTGPLFPATYYIRYAEALMERANTRKDYRTVATALAYAAALCGEFKLAQKAAEKIALKHWRKKALHEELRNVGFDV
ncbi:MAG: hypothetical protein Q4B54_14330 [Coriobacteriales bacterium]|nr:hypothetical protein [Coriobacteriales bacterium]